jgi:C-terminal processing protease CtpA/Prc
VVAALQDQRRAVVLGARTAGAGRMQVLYIVPDAGVVAVSVGIIYRPSGELLDGAGVTPDIQVEAGQAVGALLADVPCPGDPSAGSVGNDAMVVRAEAELSR